jgi:hypothetical protein
LQSRQQGLRDRLDALQRQMKALGLNSHEGLDDAGRAMGDAQRSLAAPGGGDDAVEAQGRALEALQRGAQSLAQQMQQQGSGSGQAAGPGQPPDGSGPAQAGVDPLGRESRGSEYDSESRYDPLGAPAAQRAQQVLQELRRRLGNAGRPKAELDYLERLLDEDAR